MASFADVLAIAVALAAAWLLWSGHIEPLLIGFGVVSCALVLLISYRMRILELENASYRLTPRLPFYLPWLLREIAKANVHIARVILTPSLPIHPRLIRVTASQKSPLGQAIYANSITLTPGTLTLDVRDSTILVHALTEQSAADLRSGEMDRRVAALERGSGAD